MPADSEPRLLVITGAAGRIGSFYLRRLHGSHAAGGGFPSWRLRLVDVRDPEDPDPADEVIAGKQDADLSDLDVARRAVAGPTRSYTLPPMQARTPTSTARCSTAT